MLVRVVRPDHLAPSELDDYLEKGWFRIGQALMTCRVVQFDGELRPAIWTRLPLVGHAFKKSVRRVLARNDARYRVEVGEVVIDDEREALYQRYRSLARGERSPSLVDFLYGDSDRDVYDTREIRVFDGDRLAAFSWFDRGLNSVQSLIGVYDPERQRDSLGLFTMLHEVRHAQQEGLAFHYPGYVLPGDPAMDYKLRLGAVEFLDPWLGTWRPMPDLPEVPLPTVALERGLAEVRSALEGAGVTAEVRRYPWFEAPAWQPDLTACLEHPLVVECFPDRKASSLMIVTFDVDRRMYGLLRCLRARAVTRSRFDVDVPIELWLVAERMASRSTAEGIAHEVARLSGGLVAARGGELRLLVSMGLKPGATPSEPLRGRLREVDADSERVVRELAWEADPAHTPGPGSHQEFTAAEWSADGRLLQPAHTALLTIRPDRFTVDRTVSHPLFHGVHSAAPGRGGRGVVLTCAGTESVLELDDTGAVERHHWLRRGAFTDRYGSVDLRKVDHDALKPHSHHPNHAAFVEDELWVTCFETQEAVALDTERRIALPEAIPHDGRLRGGLLWFTQVVGRVIAVDPRSLERRVEIELRSLSSDRRQLGWCRGVEVVGSRLFVGLTMLRATRHREALRQMWLGGPGAKRPTRVVEIDLDHPRIVREIEVGNAAGGTIYSILAVP